jgi:hypothetical protein
LTHLPAAGMLSAMVATPYDPVPCTLCGKQVEERRAVEYKGSYYCTRECLERARMEGVADEWEFLYDKNF